jgi:hypothetical protein
VAVRNVRGVAPQTGRPLNCGNRSRCPTGGRRPCVARGR